MAPLTQMSEGSAVRIIAGAAPGSGSAFLAETFKALGVTHIFYVPVLMPEAMKALTRLGIEPIVTHGEKAAAYMADGYARVAHRPGVCGSQNIGGSNLAAGLRDAYLSRMPVLALTGGPTTQTRYRQAYQEFDDLPLFAALTKFSARVDNVERLPDLLASAFRAATTGTPRPVHLQFDGFYAASLNDPLNAKTSVDTRYGSFPAFRPRAAPEDISTALRALATAERPVIVAGGGVQTSRAADVLRAFAAQMRIPIAVSLNAKSIIVDADPLALGCVGEYSCASANRALAEADLVFFIGTPTGGLTTLNWVLPHASARVVHLDIDPESLGRNYPDCIPLCGDARAVLEQMLENAPQPSIRRDWLARCAEFRTHWHSTVHALETADSGTFRPERLCRLISECMPKNAILVGDTGHAAAWIAQNLAVTSNDQLIIRADGSLGWSLPAAIGAKCAAPHREVIAFGGDASFLYHIGELETAVRYSKKIIAIVNNNVSMNQEKVFWGDDPAYAANWRFHDTDFVCVAEGLGCLAMRAENSESFVDAFRRALVSNRSVVIDARTDELALPQPTWRPSGARDTHSPSSERDR